MLVCLILFLLLNRKLYEGKGPSPFYLPYIQSQSVSRCSVRICWIKLTQPTRISLWWSWEVYMLRYSLLSIAETEGSTEWHCALIGKQPAYAGGSECWTFWIVTLSKMWPWADYLIPLNIFLCLFVFVFFSCLFKWDNNPYTIRLL